MNLDLVESSILDDASCTAKVEAYVGCRMAFEMALAQEAISNDEQRRLRGKAKQEFEAGQTQSFAASWRRLRERHQDLDDGDRAALSAELVNLFLSHAQDPHTYISTLAEYEFDSDSGLESVDSGIGVLIGRTQTEVIVRDLYDNGPAERSGVQVGDVIRKIDGQQITSERFVEASRLLQAGPVGSTVLLNLGRGARDLEIRVTRARATFTPFKGEILRSTSGGAVAYLKVRNFTDWDAYYDLRVFVQDHLNEPGLQGWILDLRGNGGGDMQIATSVAGLFLPDEAPVYSMYYPRDNLRFEKKSTSTRKTSLPIVTLIDARTASAAEMLAAALRDHNVSYIIGQRSFGKGTVQMASRVDSMSFGFTKVPAAKMEKLSQEILYNKSIALMLGPSLTTHQVRGISPDLEARSDISPESPKRESDLFVNPLQPTAAEYVDAPERAAIVRSIDACMSGSTQGDARDQVIRKALSALPCYERALR